MTKLEKQLGSICKDYCEDASYEQDPREGHFHIEPAPPEFLGDVLFDVNPARIFFGSEDWSVDDLKKLHEWLDDVLQESA